MAADTMENSSEKIAEIMRILDLPKYTIAFTLIVREGQLPRVECEFHPEDKKNATALSMERGYTAKIEKTVE
jgi:hypothetical protein